MQTAERTLAELLDLAQLQRVCDGLCAAGNVGAAILDPAGVVVVAAGRQDICRPFHRVHEDTLRGCLESDARLHQRLVDGLDAPGHYAYQGADGLRDVAFPLVVAGEHVASILIGPFLYDDDVADEAASRERAQRLGYDEAAYLEALAPVPVISHERATQIICFLTAAVGMLGDLGLAAQRLTREREALRESEALYRSIVRASPDGITITDLQGRIRVAPPATLTMFGYELEEEMLGHALTELLVLEDRERAQAAIALMRQASCRDWASTAGSAPTEARLTSR